MLICIGGSEDHAFPILCVALVTARGSATSTEPCSGRDRARAGPPTWQQVVGRTTPGPVCPVPHPIRHTLCGRGRASPAMIRSRSWSVHAGARLFGPAADPSHTFHAGPHWMRCAGPGRPHGARGARERETPRAAISVGPMRNPMRDPGSRSGSVVPCWMECESRDEMELSCNARSLPDGCALED